MTFRPLLERSATLALLFSSAIAVQLAAQRSHEDYDEVDPAGRLRRAGLRAADRRSARPRL